VSGRRFKKLATPTFSNETFRGVARLFQSNECNHRPRGNFANKPTPRKFLDRHQVCSPRLAKRPVIMTIWMNNRLSGFRNWSEAQEVQDGPEAQESRRQIQPCDKDQPCDKELSDGNQTPHRPWLVPGAGRI
jgi:hypothetical protein